MRIFLLVFLALYGGMNYYFFRKVQAAYLGSKLWMVLLGAFLVLAIAAPILVRAFERTGHARMAWLAAAVGYCWIAILFWFCVLAAAADGWNLGMKCLAHWKPSASRLLLDPRPALALYGAVILIAACWGVLEAQNIRLQTVRIKPPKLAPGSAAVRIVEVCDIHLSPILRERTLGKIIGIISEAKPDIIAFTGDMTDETYENGEGLAAMLATVEAPLGKFGVLGNHEYYTGLEASLRFFKAAGIRTLRCESVVTGPVRIAGVDDPAGIATGQECRLDEATALGPPGDPCGPAASAENCTPEACPRAAGTGSGSATHPTGGRPLDQAQGKPVILLKHRPQVNLASVGRFDLQLSGHSHGGQIFPFTLIVRFFIHGAPGLRRIGPDSWLYHSRGAGTWGPPMRLLAPPEVTLIVLEHA